VARLIAPALIAGLAPLALEAPAFAEPDRAVLESWAPPGGANVAAGAAATASSSGSSPYTPDATVDGNVGTPGLNLWSTAAGDLSLTGGWLNIDLAAEAQIRRVVVFPRGDSGFYGVYFPAKYTVKLLDAAGQAVWSADVAHANSASTASAIVAAPDVVEVEPAVAASTVRIEVAERHAREGGIIQISEVAVFNEGQIVQYYPPGADNLARDASLAAESSREDPAAKWGAQYLNDEYTDTASGWSSQSLPKVTDPAQPTGVQYDLGVVSRVSRLVVFPHAANFPRDYRFETSTDGETWQTAATSAGNPDVVAEPQVFDLAQPVAARYVRLVVSARNTANSDPDYGYVVQLAEVAVFGTQSVVTLSKPALEMAPGAVEQAWFSLKGSSEGLAFDSSDPQVASVDQTGRITALAEGAAVITAHASGNSAGIELQVSQDIKRVGPDILITGFYGPAPEYVNQDQFAAIGDFGLDLLMGVGNHPGLAENLQMATLSAQNGFLYMPHESRLGCGALLGKTAAEVESVLASYTNVPGIGGFLLCDEAMPATDYATAFNAAAAYAPELYPHYNFCPWGLCGVDADSTKAWLEATGGVRSDWSAPDYLMFDMYPLKEVIYFSNWFSNLENVRQLGLEYQIKTATYLQAVGYSSGAAPTRTPTAAEIAWEANTALAYGYKQLAYFTYWQPTGTGEVFSEGIMAADGTKSARFDALKQLNSEIHALGPTLMGLDATAVYFNGAANGQQAVPKSLGNPKADGSLPDGTFFVQADGTQDLLLSHMVDRQTNEHYLFVVNNAFDATTPAATEVTLTFADAVGSLAEVSRQDGSETAVALSGHQLSLRLAGAEGRLYRLSPVDRSALAEVVAEAEALAASAYTTASWAALEQALAGAQTALAGAGATQAEVDSAAETLQAAIEGLVEALELSVAVSKKCLGSKVYLSVRVANQSDQAVALSVESAYGAKQFASIAGGGAALHAFTTGQVAYGAGLVEVTAAAAPNLAGYKAVAYPAQTCAR
jgi:flagellin-like hook-associated protein FlgL